MARDDGGYWLPIHSGLLRDERWAGMTPAQRGAWVTAFLLLDGEPRAGWFRDRSRLVWLLQREGWRERDARSVVEYFDSVGWLKPESDDSPAVTLRGWHEYTERGRKAVYNAARTDRGDRSVEYARRNAARRGRTRENAGDSGRPTRDETIVSPSPARTGGGGRDGGDGRKAREYTGTKSFKDAMAEAGFDPSALKPKRVLTDTTDA